MIRWLHGRLVWRADTNKARRCPCWAFPEEHPLACNGYVSSEETDWTFKRLHVYRCGKCGIKVTTFPGWPGLPGTDEFRYWPRAKWFFGRGLWWRVSSWWDHRKFRLLVRWLPKAATGEEPYVRRLAWKDRLLFNCWRAPFPYLFHRWEVVQTSDEDNGYYNYIGSWVRRRSAQAWVDEYERLGRDDEGQ